MSFGLSKGDGGITKKFTRWTRILLYCNSEGQGVALYGEQEMLSLDVYEGFLRDCNRMI